MFAMKILDFFILVKAGAVRFLATVLNDVFEVFTSIGEWITTSIPQIGQLFYSAETGLTFIGVLAIAGLGISVTLLLLNIIRSYLKFR